METQVYKMEKKTDKISHADLVQKYLKPYLRFSLPLCALETTALWLLLRCGSAFWSLMLGFLLLVVFPLLLLWHFLFSRWYPGRFLCVHVHVWLVCISQGLIAVWLVIGHQATAAFSAGWQWLAWLPALVVYALGVGYVYFFGKRNETVYLTKKIRRRLPAPGWRVLLRTYLPSFFYCDLLLAALLLLHGAVVHWLPVLAGYMEAVDFCLLLVYILASWRLLKLGLIGDFLGFRSYPFTLLQFSTLMLMVSALIVCSADYGQAFLAQFFALVGYLNAFYFYEQEKTETRGNR